MPRQLGLAVFDWFSVKSLQIPSTAKHSPVSADNTGTSQSQWCKQRGYKGSNPSNEDYNFLEQIHRVSKKTVPVLIFE